ncbi:unnamed protein product [Mytilus edulis]|uniref:Uncharacterized protein n=1 Tax=Mytilus edulis TaxID=6550 RepID=A0A8S3U957_MYTED|nr:unnamed protein product [Mytilus edulis]
MERTKPVLNDICLAFQNAIKLNAYIRPGSSRKPKKIVLDTASEQEHDIVHGVVDLMRTLLDNPLQKIRYIGQNITKLRRFIINNPKHLNTLADLTELYRTSNMIQKANIIDDKIRKILESGDPNDLKEKPICTVEQGYAVLFEEDTENEIEAQQKLFDSFELMKAEQKISVGKRKCLLSRASNHTVNARRLLCLAINCRHDESVIDERNKAWKCFKRDTMSSRYFVFYGQHLHLDILLRNGLL